MISTITASNNAGLYGEVEPYRSCKYWKTGGRRRLMLRLSFIFGSLIAGNVLAQVPPNQTELRQYRGLFAAVAEGDVAQVEQQLATIADLEARDTHGRTALLVAVHLSHDEAARLVLEAGANVNALDHQRYDLITIAAVNNDVDMIRLGLEFGADSTTVTSPYAGTALIAAAHLGHVETVNSLITAGAPLDHVNNLGWTALIEAIVLGDGGDRHYRILQLLINSGANVNLADRTGKTPIALARERGYLDMVRLLELAGAQ